MGEIAKIRQYSAFIVWMSCYHTIAQTCTWNRTERERERAKWMKSLSVSFRKLNILIIQFCCQFMYLSNPFWHSFMLSIPILVPVFVTLYTCVSVLSMYPFNIPFQIKIITIYFYRSNSPRKKSALTFKR